MRRVTFRDIDELNALTIVRWSCRIAFAFAFGVVFAVVLIFARWSLETKQRDQTVEFTAIRLQAENEQLRVAIAEMQRQMKPTKQNARNIGGE